MYLVHKRHGLNIVCLFTNSSLSLKCNFPKTNWKSQKVMDFTFCVLFVFKKMTYNGVGSIQLSTVSEATRGCMCQIALRVSNQLPHLQIQITRFFLREIWRKSFAHNPMTNCNTVYQMIDEIWEKRSTPYKFLNCWYTTTCYQKIAAFL